MDGIALEEYTIPPLTSISQPRSEQGETAAKMLLQWINTREKPDNTILQPMLCERCSVLQSKR